jgi:hypothetical protein
LIASRPPRWAPPKSRFAGDDTGDDTGDGAREAAGTGGGGRGLAWASNAAGASSAINQGAPAIGRIRASNFC